MYLLIDSLCIFKPDQEKLRPNQFIYDSRNSNTRFSRVSSALRAEHREQILHDFLPCGEW